MKSVVVREVSSVVPGPMFPRGGRWDGLYGLVRLIGRDIGEGRMPCPDWAWLGLANGDSERARELKAVGDFPRDPEVSAVTEPAVAYFCFSDNNVGWQIHPFASLSDDSDAGPALVWVREPSYGTGSRMTGRQEARSEAVADMAKELRAGKPIPEHFVDWERLLPILQSMEDGDLTGEALARAWDDVFRALLDGEPEPVEEPPVEEPPVEEPPVEEPAVEEPPVEEPPVEEPPVEEPPVEEPAACPFRMGTLKSKPRSSKKRGKRR